MKGTKVAGLGTGYRTERWLVPVAMCALLAGGCGGPQKKPAHTSHDPLVDACWAGDESACVKLRSETEKGCEEGRAESCRRLGLLWDQGKGGFTDPARARTLYERACEHGDPKGCHNAAEMWIFGRGGPKDEAKGRALHESACKGGVAWSCLRAGKMWEEGTGGPEVAARTREFFARARRLAERSCEEGGGRECGELAVMLTDGLGGPKDPARARRYLEKACAAGDDRACEGLARVYYFGVGVAKDRAKAREFLGVGCSLRDADMCDRLADMWETGVGGAKDVDKARDLRARAISFVHVDRLDFGAFSISVPAGEVVEETSASALGRYGVRTDYGNFVVAWEKTPDPSSKEVFLQHILPPALGEIRNLEEGELSVGDARGFLKGFLLDRNGEKTRYVTALLRCPDGLEALIVGAGPANEQDAEYGERLKSLHRRTLESFRCGTSAPQADLPFLVFQPPDGYGYLRAPPGQPGIEHTFVARDGSLFFFVATPVGSGSTAEDRKARRLIVEQAMKSARLAGLDVQSEPELYEHARSDGRRVEMWKMSVRDGGSAGAAYFRVISCEAFSWTGTYWAGGGVREDAIEALARADCPGAASLPVEEYASAASVLVRGCSGGGDSGCALFHQYAASGQIVPGDFHGEELRLACVAGFQAACDHLPAEPAHVASLRESCEGGNLLDCAELGVTLIKGLGVPKDEVQGNALLSRACTSGLPIACTNLGNSYLFGRGLPKDERKAVELFEKACGSGEKTACVGLGLCLAGMCDEVPRDEVRARELFEKNCGIGRNQACDVLEKALGE